MPLPCRLRTAYPSSPGSCSANQSRRRRRISALSTTWRWWHVFADLATDPVHRGGRSRYLAWLCPRVAGDLPLRAKRRLSCSGSKQLGCQRRSGNPERESRRRHAISRYGRTRFLTAAHQAASHCAIDRIPGAGPRAVSPNQEWRSGQAKQSPASRQANTVRTVNLVTRYSRPDR